MTYATSHEIVEALQANHDEPHGTIRCATAEDLAAAAERLGDDSLLVTALCELMNAYEYGAEPGKAPVTLARLLAIFDRNSGAFSDWETHNLHWFFKWVTHDLLELPDVPIRTVHDWLDQMSDRYAAAGLKSQAVHAMRYQVAEHTGVDADVAYAAWSTRPRDTMSDCEACEARQRGRYYALRGNDARALDEWQPVLDGRLTCAEEPAATIASALVPMARQGRLEDAASGHRSGYRLVRGNVNLAVAAGEHIEFCGLTGNNARGVELLAHSRGYFAQPATFTHLRFIAGVQVLLAKLVADGYGDIPVAGPPGTSHSAASLLDQVAADATALAARFDARNGTTWIGDRYRERSAALPLTSQPLALGFRGAQVVSQPATRPATAAPAQAAEAVPARFADLLARAREYRDNGRPDADPLWDRIAELVAAAESAETGAASVDGVAVDHVLRGELALHSGYASARSGQWGEAEEAFRAAHDAFDEGGQPGRAVAAMARSWWSVFGPGADLDPVTVSAAWAGLDEALERSRELLSAQQMKPDHYLAVLHCRVLARLHDDPGLRDGAPTGGEHENLYAECELLRAEALRLGMGHRAAVALSVRAHVAAGDGQHEEAEAAAREALTLLRECGRPWLLPNPCCFLADVLTRTGHPDEARALVHEALTQAETWPDADFDRAGALMVLGQACQMSGDAQAAAGYFADAAGRLDRQGQPQAASAARAFLGQALVGAGRPRDAVAVLESLRDDGEGGLPPRQRAQVRLDLGRGLGRLGEHRAAAQEFVWLADFIAGWDDGAEMMIMVGGELASSLAAASLWDQADAAVERTMQAHAAHPNPAAICQMLRMVAEASMNNRGIDATSDTLGYLQRADEVNEQATEVAGVYARWPETAQTAELRARVLAEANRNEESLAAAEISLLAYQSGGDDRTLPRQAELTRIAAILQGLRLGQRDTAIARLTPMIDRCQAAGLADQAGQLTDLRGRLTA